ncbi:histidine phosphatase family protein [Dongia sedimenti]|uniref:Histidine phosphatase family protein n=1 Tax=Dongia sedimenti TaxID=3064282 RepID=A0ABU0YLU5_9PROT|nr:histidine phosphatase family protein [Rhodospirillaceae bacterium R-7]
MLPHHSFYFLRHGETDWNKARRLQGLTDVPLNARGEEQAALARTIAAGLGLKSIAVSSLSRARRTAEIVNRDLGLPVTHYDTLREFDVGPYEGSTDGSWLEHWFTDGAVEGPESFSNFRQRILGGMIEALTLEHPVLIVAHGGVFWALQRMLGFAELAHIPNAVVARFDPPATVGGPWQITLLSGAPSPQAVITA